jgi:hypothetical protein
VKWLTFQEENSNLECQYLKNAGAIRLFLFTDLPHDENFFNLFVWLKLLLLTAIH